jgi:stress response protein SCP2
MGWETANIHLGGGSAAAILRDLRRKPGHWLFKAASQMQDQVLEDWREFSI